MFANRRVLAFLTLLPMPFAAYGGPCDALVKKAGSAKGTELVGAYKSLLTCDHAVAEDAYDTFMKGSGDVDTLVALSIVAIEGKATGPVLKMLDKIPDYSARDEVAKGIGAACSSHPLVVSFLQGTYAGLGDIQFSQWNDAFVSCDVPGLQAWLESTATSPPASTYNEKYATILSSLARRSGPAALPTLEKAAIAADKNDGPFGIIMDKMSEAVRPQEIGGSVSSENKQQLVEALVSIANSVGPEKAAVVAERLYNLGATDRAATLLPRVYPDRVQSGGKLLYGAASVEVCDKEAVVHWASVAEPAKRWSIVTDVETPVRAFKPKLKCAPGAPWPVVTTPEPVKSQADISVWADQLVAQWSGKGLAVKGREEKAFALP